MSRMSIMLDDMEDYGFDDIPRSALARLVDDAHKELCLRESWPFLEVVENVSVAANDNTPTTTGSLNKVLSIVNTGTGDVLEPIRTEMFYKRYAENLTETGNPVKYYFIGEALYLYPTPSTPVTLSIYYLKAPGTLNESSNDSDWLWPSRHDAVILYAALSKAYYINDDPQGAAMQTVMESRLQVARDDMWMRQYDRTDRVVILDDNEYLI